MSPPDSTAPTLSGIVLTSDLTLDMKDQVLEKQLTAKGRSFTPSLHVICDQKDRSLTLTIETLSPSAPEPTFPGHSSLLVEYDRGKQLIVFARDTGTSLILQGPANNQEVDGRLFQMTGKDSMNAPKERLLENLLAHRQFRVYWMPRGETMRVAQFDVSGLSEAFGLLPECRGPTKETHPVAEKQPLSTGAVPSLRQGRTPAPPLRLKETLTREDFVRFGLDKLSPGQLSDLEKWLSAYMSAVPGRTDREHTIRSTPRSEPGTPDVIESVIEGEFTGWEGETIFKLDNGQIWQQAEYDYTYEYAYRPEVVIYRTREGYRMKVEDVEETILVRRLK